MATIYYQYGLIGFYFIQRVIVPYCGCSGAQVVPGWIQGQSQGPRLVGDQKISWHVLLLLWLLLLLELWHTLVTRFQAWRRRTSGWIGVRGSFAKGVKGTD